MKSNDRSGHATSSNPSNSVGNAGAGGTSSTTVTKIVKIGVVYSGDDDDIVGRAQLCFSTISRLTLTPHTNPIHIIDEKTVATVFIVDYNRATDFKVLIGMTDLTITDTTAVR